MLPTLLLPALAAGAAFALPQGVNFGVVEVAAPATALGPEVNVTSQAPTAVYDSSVVQASVSAAVAASPVNATPGVQGSSKVKRQAACAVQPAGSGPTIKPDTAAAFEKSPVLAAYAILAIPPVGYTEAFVNLNGSVSMATYMGLYTLTRYSPADCATYCNDATGCLGFNIFFERDPSVDPGPTCPNPPSTDNIKCTLWGSPVTAASATNTGQYRDEFEVVIAGSNGYNMVDCTPPTPPNFLPPTPFSGAIDVLTDYVGARFFNQPYDAGVCAALCSATTVDNRAAAEAAGESSYVPCNYFNAYILSENEVPQGVYCSLYSAVIASSAKTFTTVVESGNTYSAGHSYGFQASTIDTGVVA